MYHLLNFSHKPCLGEMCCLPPTSHSLSPSFCKMCPQHLNLRFPQQRARHHMSSCKIAVDCILEGTSGLPTSTGMHHCIFPQTICFLFCFCRMHYVSYYPVVICECNTKQHKTSLSPSLMCLSNIATINNTFASYFTGQVERSKGMRIIKMPCKAMCHQVDTVTGNTISNFGGRNRSFWELLIRAPTHHLYGHMMFAQDFTQLLINQFYICVPHPYEIYQNNPWISAVLTGSQCATFSPVKLSL